MPNYHMHGPLSLPTHRLQAVCAQPPAVFIAMDDILYRPFCLTITIANKSMLPSISNPFRYRAGHDCWYALDYSRLRLAGLSNTIGKRLQIMYIAGL